MRLPFALAFSSGPRHPSLPTAFLLLSLLLQPISAIVSLCSVDFGHPKAEDCVAALLQFPILQETLFFEPRPAKVGSTECPAVIKHKTCKITVRCSDRITTSWLMLRAISRAVVEGYHGDDAPSRIGCATDLGVGGVATPHYANDPIWLEVSETGVPGPPEDGIAAPLLKGVSPDQLYMAGLGVPPNLAGYSPLVMFGDRDRTGQLTQETDPVLFVTGKGESKTKGTPKAKGSPKAKGRRGRQWGRRGQ